MLYTDPAENPPEDLSDKIDIVARGYGTDRSRIVRAMSQREGSELLAFDVDGDASPWLARARSNLQIMYRTALAVSHTLDIDQLLDRIMQLIFEWVEADRGCIMLLDEQTKQLVPKVRRNRQGFASSEKLAISKTILDYVMQHNEGVLTSDAREDDRWDHAASIVQMGIREAICVPMQGRYDVVGVIYIDTSITPQRIIQQKGHQNKFTEEHLKLMIAIAHQAALAVEDTRYYSAMMQAERLAAVGQTIAMLSHHIKNILQGIRGGSYLIETGLRAARRRRRAQRLGHGRAEPGSASRPWSWTCSPSARSASPTPCPATSTRSSAKSSNWCSRGRPSWKWPCDWHPAKTCPRDVRPRGDSSGRAQRGHQRRRRLRRPRRPAKVTIATRVLPDREAWCESRSQDNGCGIPPEEIERIFTIFVSRQGWPRHGAGAAGQPEDPEGARRRHSRHQHLGPGQPLHARAARHRRSAGRRSDGRNSGRADLSLSGGNSFGSAACAAQPLVSGRLAHEGVGPLFVAHGRRRPVTWQDLRVVGQREQLGMDVRFQVVEAAVRKIGAADTAREQHVAAKDQHRLAAQQTNTTWPLECPGISRTSNVEVPRPSKCRPRASRTSAGGLSRLAPNAAERLSPGSVSFAASPWLTTIGQFGKSLLERAVASDVVAVSVRNQDGRRRKRVLVEVAQDFVGFESRVEDKQSIASRKVGNVGILLERVPRLDAQPTRSGGVPRNRPFLGLGAASKMGSS